jgi:hypothetical protein
MIKYSAFPHTDLAVQLQMFCNMLLPNNIVLGN